MKKIIAFILCTACLLFSACSLNEISSQSNNSSINTVENSYNSVYNSDSPQNSESSFESENTENILTNESSSAGNTLQEEILSGDYQATNADEMSPYLVGYRTKMVVSLTDTFSMNIAPSLISFPLNDGVDELKLFVRTSDGKELLLDTFQAEDFTQELYGCTMHYNNDGYISQVVYHSFDEYFIPTELLSNEGWLSFELRTYMNNIQGSCGFAPTLYYVCRNNTLYFSI